LMINQMSWKLLYISCFFGLKCFIITNKVCFLNVYNNRYKNLIHLIIFRISPVVVGKHSDFINRVYLKWHYCFETINVLIHLQTYSSTHTQYIYRHTRLPTRNTSTDILVYPHVIHHLFLPFKTKSNH
jgi:hypothetical protein